MSTVEHFDAGNPAGSLSSIPTIRKHYCLRAAPSLFSIESDTPVYDCSAWDPLSIQEWAAREMRRMEWADQGDQ